MKKKVDNLGRIILPAEVRRDLGIQVGEELNLDVDDEKLFYLDNLLNARFVEVKRSGIRLRIKDSVGNALKK